MSSGSKFRPNMLGIICNWCCYGGADLCGVSRFQYPPYIRLIRVMCSARVDLAHILTAFTTGQDGVFVGGCHLGDCHYITNGNYNALSMVRLCQRLLEHAGINPDRLRIEWVSAGEGIRFANIMNEFSSQIERFGPLGGSEAIDSLELKARLDEIIKMIPYIKLTKREKLGAHITENSDQAYGELYTREEIAELFSNVSLSYYIDPERCQACMICSKRCPVEAIEGGKNMIHVIDQDKCIKCGTCFESCPPRFGAIKKLMGEPVPPPVPEEKRSIVRKSKEK
jgi:F420-non-reducing hydrogenase iron-sulfur subunit